MDVKPSTMLILIVIGFLLHQASFAALTGQITVIDEALASLITAPWLRYQAWFGLEVVGGLLAIFGLALYVKFLVSSELKKLKIPKPAEVEAQVKEAALKASEVSVAKTTCKFCGAVVEGGAVFCPVCGKSQI